jgi:hypothetical protein
MGQAAHERVRQRFLGLRALVQYGALMDRLPSPSLEVDREPILH